MCLTASVRQASISSRVAPRSSEEGSAPHVVPEPARRENLLRGFEGAGPGVAAFVASSSKTCRQDVRVPFLVSSSTCPAQRAQTLAQSRVTGVRLRAQKKQA